MRWLRQALVLLSASLLGTARYCSTCKLFWLYQIVYGFKPGECIECQKNKHEVELCSNLFSSVRKLSILSIKLKYPGFFTSFQFSSLHYVLFLWKYNSVMGIYAFKRQKNLKKHCVYNHGNSCLFCFTLIHL